MKKIIAVVCVLFLTLSCGTTKKSTYLPKKDILVFTKTNGYRHASIETGVTALKEIASENHWAIKHSEDSLIFNSVNLKKYDLIVFLNTTGDILGDEEQIAFQNYMVAEIEANSLVFTLLLIPNMTGPGTGNL